MKTSAGDMDNRDGSEQKLCRKWGMSMGIAQIQWGLLEFLREQ